MRSFFAGIFALLVSLAPIATAQQCNQSHDHDALPWPLATCPWEDTIDWCASDEGHNEGADTAAAVLMNAGLGLPETVATAGSAALADLWPRSEMIDFAEGVAKSGHPREGAALVLACQWHNCDASKCLSAHEPEVANWLMTH